jgi:hypothetical protein
MIDDAFQPRRIGTTSSPNRSAKINRRLSGTLQANRRVITRRCICVPAQGRSAICLACRLWIRRDPDPHNGHLAISDSGLTVKIIYNLLNHFRPQSPTQPVQGTKFRSLSAWLIPPLENRKSSAKFIEM